MKTKMNSFPTGSLVQAYRQYNVEYSPHIEYEVEYVPVESLRVGDEVIPYPNAPRPATVFHIEETRVNKLIELVHLGALRCRPMQAVRWYNDTQSWYRAQDIAPPVRQGCSSLYSIILEHGTTLAVDGVLCAVIDRFTYQVASARLMVQQLQESQDAAIATRWESIRFRLQGV